MSCCCSPLGPSGGGGGSSVAEIAVRLIGGGSGGLATGTPFDSDPFEVYPAPPFAADAEFLLVTCHVRLTISGGENTMDVVLQFSDDNGATWANGVSWSQDLDSTPEVIVFVPIQEAFAFNPAGVDPLLCRVHIDGGTINGASFTGAVQITAQLGKAP